MGRPRQPTTIQGCNGRRPSDHWSGDDLRREFLDEAIFWNSANAGSFWRFRGNEPTRRRVGGPDQRVEDGRRDIARNDRRSGGDNSRPPSRDDDIAPCIDRRTCGKPVLILRWLLEITSS